MPDDNSVLPDLQSKLPSYSAGAGFKFPTVTDTYIAPQIMSTKYDQFNPEQLSGITPIKFDAPNANENLQLNYTKPQVSATAGMNTPVREGFTAIDLDLFYNRPQVSVSAGHSGPQAENFVSERDFNLRY
jgi:hypothetical protein